MLALGSLALALARPEALIPQEPSLDNLAQRLSTGGSVQRQFTCMVDDIDKTCPGVKALSKLNQHLAYLKPPANEKWLFWGSSYMSQMFQVVLAANREDIVEESDITADFTPANLTDPEGHVAAREAYLKENFMKQCRGAAHSHFTAAFADANSLEAKLSTGCDGPCNLITDPDCKCKSIMGALRVKLKNGAELYAITNSRVFQDHSEPAVTQLLQEWLNLPDLKLNQIWYMEAHGSNYFKEHCRAVKLGREVDDTKLVDMSGYDSCFKANKMHNGRHSGEVALGDNKTGVIQTPTTMSQYVDCVKAKPAFQKLNAHVAAHGTSMMIVAPWAVHPEAWTKHQIAEVYSTFEVGHKYSCVAGGSTPEQNDYGIGLGACSSPMSANDLAMSKYASKNVYGDVFVNSKVLYQANHPCVVICEPKNGPHSCIPGPAAKMALDMVTRARGTSTSATWEGYDGFNDANHMSQVFDMQNACEEASQQS